MTSTESSVGRAKIFRLSGRLDFKAMRQSQKLQEKIRQAEQRLVMLDFGGVPYIDSAGLGLLAIVHEELAPPKKKLILVNPQEGVKRILELGNMGSFFSICETEQEALSQ